MFRLYNSTQSEILLLRCGNSASNILTTSICLKSTCALISHMGFHTWLNCKGLLGEGKNAFYIQLETTAHVWPGKLLCVRVPVCACLRACMHACECVWVRMCGCVHVNSVLALGATPTHSHVSHSLSEKDPVRQSYLCPNWYDCRLAVFILVFTHFYAYWTWLHRRVLACGGGVSRQSTSIIHNHHQLWRTLVCSLPALVVS